MLPCYDGLLHFTRLPCEFDIMVRERGKRKMQPVRGEKCNYSIDPEGPSQRDLAYTTGTCGTAPPLSLVILVAFAHLL